MHNLDYQQLARLHAAWGWALCSLVLLAMGLCTASVGQAGGGSIAVELAISPSRAEADADLVMSVVARNTSEDLVSFQPPRREDISVTVTGPDDGAYMVAWQTAGAGATEARTVWLQPQCAFEAVIGTIRVAKAPGGEPGVPPGRDTVDAKWQAPLPGTEGPRSLSAIGHVEVITSPLVVSLPPVTVARHGAGPILLRVKLTNGAAYPIVLLDYLVPYKQHFQVRIARRRSSMEPSTPPKRGEPMGVTLVTPDARGWLTLLPGEAVWVDMDVKDAVAQPGVYDVALVHPGRVILKPPDRDPYYSDATRWAANEAQLVVLEAPSEGKADE